MASQDMKFDFEENEVAPKKWKIEEVRLLITKRLEMEAEFGGGKKKKSVLWGTVLRNIKEIDPSFPYSREEIIKKFSNLLGTFQKIKKRHKKSGEGTITWIFYDLFNDVYGTSYTVDPSENTIIQTLSGEESDTEVEYESPPKKARKNLYDLIKSENEKMEHRHKELLEIEKTNIELERTKLQTLVDLKEILKQCLSENN